MKILTGLFTQLTQYNIDNVNKWKLKYVLQPAELNLNNTFYTFTIFLYLLWLSTTTDNGAVALHTFKETQNE